MPAFTVNAGQHRRFLLTKFLHKIFLKPSADMGEEVIESSQEDMFPKLLLTKAGLHTFVACTLYTFYKKTL